MSSYAYELLPASDTSLLAYESFRLPMQSSVLQIFDAGPLRGADGGIDFTCVREHVASKLHRVPAYRKKIVWLENRDAIWVDDADFDLDYHVRHAALPRPGDHSQLKQLAARLMEQRLDPERPLWETWLVEGLEGDRFALLCKAHLCLLAAAPNSDLSGHLLSPDPTGEAEAAPKFIPRSAPSGGELRLLAWRRRMSIPARVVKGVLRNWTDALEPMSEFGGQLRALKELAASQLSRAPESPLNGPVGPHRGFETVTVPMPVVLGLQRKLVTSLDALLFGLLTGALREFMLARQVSLESLDFQVSAPCIGHENGKGRNAHARIRLPLEESHPKAQLAEIGRQMRAAKHDDEAAAEEVLDQLSGWMSLDLQKAVAQSSHCMLSSKRGPSFPLFLSGARLLAAYPQPPLLENQALAIGVLTYDGRLCLGIEVDRDRVPDVARLAECFENSVAGLQQAAAGSAPEANATGSVRGADFETSEERSTGAESSCRETPAPWPKEVTAPSHPSEIREQVFAQHRALTHLLDAVDMAAKRVGRGDEDEIAVLRERGIRLHDRLVDHLAFEDRFLVPTVRDIDGWGAERAGAIVAEHRDQRALLEFILAQLEDRRTASSVLASQLSSFVELMRKDMEGEEQGVLSGSVLRDDVVAIGAEAG